MLSAALVPEPFILVRWICVGSHLPTGELVLVETLFCGGLGLVSVSLQFSLAVGRGRAGLGTLVRLTRIRPEGSQRCIRYP